MYICVKIDGQHLASRTVLSFSCGRAPGEAGLARALLMQRQ
jgi:hypothetical protein